MARIRVLLVLLVALAAGGGLAYGTYNYMQNVPVKTVSLPTRPVVVAAADLDLGTAVEADDLRVVHWPATRSRPARSSGRVTSSAAASSCRSSRTSRSCPMKLAIEGSRRRPARRHPARACARCRSASTRSSASPATCCRARAWTSVATASADANKRADIDLEGRADQRAGARGRHEDRAGRRTGQADARERRDAARRPRAGRAADAGEHRGQDPARAAQPARPDGAGHAGRAARRPARCAVKPASPAGRSTRASRPRRRDGGRRPPSRLPTVEVIRGDKRAEEVVR